MVKKKRKIIWDNDAAEHLQEIYDYIKADSLAAAKKVKAEIFDTIKNLTDHPEIFVADDLKENNDGSYRVFYIYSYRIVYKISDENVLILRIRHTSREPEEY